MNISPQLMTDKISLQTTGLIHRVLAPNTSGPHPTAVMIHGRAGNEDVMWIFARTIPANWLLVAPRAIQADPDGGYSWHPRQPGEWPALNKFEEAVSAVSSFIHALPQLYNADPKQIYLMGFSQGAATAYATAIKYPGLVKGIAGLVGFMPTQAETALVNLPLKGLPIFMAVGKQDPTIPYPIAIICANALRATQAQLEYYEYDTGHKLNAQGMRDLKTWFDNRHFS